MTTITRESIEIKSFITGFLSDAAHDNQSSNSLLANVFRIALASLEAEPVAWKATFTQIDHEYNTFTDMYSDKAEVERCVRLYKVGDFRADITPLYAAPPAQAQCIEVAVNDDMAYAFHHALSDSSPGADEVEEIKTGLRAAFANVTTQSAHVGPKFETWFNSQESGRSICSTQIRRYLQEISWNACCAAMLYGAVPVSQAYKLNALAGNSPVIPDGWISCSERMPDNDESKPIAIFTGKCLGQGMFVATYDDDGFFDYWEGMEIIGVSHWMPLPEPPQQ